MYRGACGKRAFISSVPCAKIGAIFAKYEIQKVRTNDQLPSYLGPWNKPETCLNWLCHQRSPSSDLRAGSENLPNSVTGFDGRTNLDFEIPSTLDC